MAVSSLSATFIPSLSLSSNSSSLLSSKAKLQSLCFVSGNTLRITNAKPLQLSTVVHAAPEVLNSEVTQDGLLFYIFALFFIFIHVCIVFGFAVMNVDFCLIGWFCSNKNWLWIIWFVCFNAFWTTKLSVKFNFRIKSSNF